MTAPAEAFFFMTSISGATHVNQVKLFSLRSQLGENMNCYASESMFKAESS